ncbi:uncharacterized protein LOC108864954 [Galendromus occidentalis]|uniref:Uncharacterized protein LOC108864954 n=1 Tax=Galendromus occidentalis TaxID=34638 RepID=A0AAJ7L8F2_9ACAR|nr:uncharacterized protein LOC108864954 [Galendromus occidentalis]
MDSSQVQSVKRPLRKVLGTNVPHFRDLEVILSGIEAMVNRRPITTVPSDTDDPEALSPADLMFGYRGNSLFTQHALRPGTAAQADMIIFSRRWIYQQKILNAFWKRFQGEYLQFLRTAHTRPPVEARPLRIGDICLLEDTNNNRALWPLCRVVAFPENIEPENARSCTITTARGQTLVRPIKKLYPIVSPDPQGQNAALE